MFFIHVSTCMHTLNGWGQHTDETKRGELVYTPTCTVCMCYVYIHVCMCKYYTCEKVPTHILMQSTWNMQHQTPQNVKNADLGPKIPR